MRFETIAIHAGDRPEATFGAISVPIYQTSTFVFQDVGKTRGYDYSRTANPTRKVLKERAYRSFYYWGGAQNPGNSGRHRSPPYYPAHPGIF